MCPASIEQMINRRFDQWRGIELPRKETWSEPRRPVITISREFGSGGKQVAEMLEQQMGLALFDRQIIDNVANQAHISAKIVASLDEHHRSAVDSWVEGILKERIFDRSEYVNLLLKVMKSLAVRGGCIILGRGGNVVLGPSPGVYHFRIVAEEKDRVARIAERDGMAPDKAAEFVSQITRDRRKFLKEAFPHLNVEDPLLFHMLFNSSRMSLEAIARIIREFVEANEHRRMADRRD